MKIPYPVIVMMFGIPFIVVVVLVLLSWAVRDRSPAVAHGVPLDMAEESYMVAVWCGESPVRMAGDAERVAAWARAHHVECPQ